MTRQRLAPVVVAALLSVALLAATAGSPAAGASAPASTAPLTQAKKKCKIVIRIVHGKKRKVRVCHTVKPKPAETVKNVSISLDAGRAATQTIGPEGGSLTATAADGTIYTLALPKDALVGPTEVQVIPVKSVTGLGGQVRVVGGVQFEPEGLGLFKPATLTITASSLSGKSTQAFSWYGEGRTIGRHPSTRTGTRIELQLTHFSGEGVAQAETDNWEERQWQFMESIQDALKAHYDQSVRPLMTKAETDDSVFVRAMQDYFGWWRQLALLGLDESAPYAQELAGLAESAKKAFQNYVNKASERCVKEHKLGEIVTLLTAARQLALFGDEQQSDAALAKAKACGRFELDFETVITRTYHDPYAEYHFESHVRVLGLQLDYLQQMLDGTGSPVTGEKQLDYLSWKVSSTSLCTSSADGIDLGDPFRVTRLSGVLPTLKAVAGADGRPQFDPPSISLSFLHGDATEWVRTTCPDSTYVSRVSSFNYAGGFNVLYGAQADGTPSSPSSRIDGWDFLGGSVYARKTYERTKAVTAQYTQTFTERTTFDLRHTPQS